MLQKLLKEVDKELKLAKQSPKKSGEEKANVMARPVSSVSLRSVADQGMKLKLKDAQAELVTAKSKIEKLEGELLDQKKAWNEALYLLNQEKNNMNDLISFESKSSKEREVSMKDRIAELVDAN